MRVIMELTGMKNFSLHVKLFKPALVCCLVLLSYGFVFSQQNSTSVAILRFNEEELKASYDKFVGGIDSLSVTRKYPEIVKKILSQNPEEQEIALKMLSESQDVDAVPWILLLLDSDNKRVRTYAGYAMKQIISSTALLRRDMEFPGFTVLKPLQKTDVDLKPMAWLVLKLLRSEDSSWIAYAITMARYLNLYEFEEIIFARRDHRAPAVTNTVKWVIEELKLQKKYEANELKKEK